MRVKDGHFGVLEDGLGNERFVLGTSILFQILVSNWRIPTVEVGNLRSIQLQCDADTTNLKELVHL